MPQVTGDHGKYIFLAKVMTEVGLELDPLPFSVAAAALRRTCTSLYVRTISELCCVLAPFEHLLYGTIYSLKMLRINKKWEAEDVWTLC